MNAQKQETSMLVHAKRVLYILGGAGIILVILSFISQYLRLFPDSFHVGSSSLKNFIKDFISEFDFNGQPDIVIYFNVLTLNAAAILLFVVAYFKNIAKDSYRIYWKALAWIIWLFAIDNLAVLHKKIRILFLGETVDGWLKYAGLIAGVVGIAIFVAVFFRFWRHFDDKYRTLFFTSAILYFLGVLGDELIKFYPSEIFSYALLITFEQALQYGGVILLIYSLLLYIPSFLPRFFVATKDAL